MAGEADPLAGRAGPPPARPGRDRPPHHGRRTRLPVHPGADRRCGRPDGRVDRPARGAGVRRVDAQDGRRPGRSRTVRRPDRHRIGDVDRADVVEPGGRHRRVADRGQRPAVGEQALEAPISAMLILGVTNPDVAAETRILTTLIGAGVGVAFSLIFPPALPTRSAGQSIVQVADAVAAPLEVAGRDLASGPGNRAQVQSWLDRIPGAERQAVESRRSLELLRDSRRLNPRALGVADVEPVLGTGLDTLEHCLRATRALFAVVQAEVPKAGEPADDPYGDELRTAFAVVLSDVADGIRAFGGLVVAEAEGRMEEAEQALAASLEILRETKAILTELIMVDARENPSSWLLRGSILAAVEQVLDQLDLEDRARLHAKWQEEQEARPLAQLPPIIDKGAAAPAAPRAIPAP